VGYQVLVHVLHAADYLAEVEFCLLFADLVALDEVVQLAL
jgi:hypothetical protein